MQKRQYTQEEIVCAAQKQKISGGAITVLPCVAAKWRKGQVPPLTSLAATSLLEN